MDIFSFLLPLWWILLEVDVLRKRFESLFELVSELLEVRGELLLLFILAFAPVIITKLVNKWLEDLVDNSVQGVNGVFTDLTEKNLVVGHVGFIDFFAWFDVSKEVTSLTSKLSLLTIRNEEFLRTVEVLDISRIVHLVWYLIVNEDTVRSLTSEEILEDLGKLW
jgi:hypothetical protein